MGSAVGTSGTKPDSAEDTEDLSQEGEDAGECEVIAVGRIEGEPMCPSCLRISASAYLETRVVCSEVYDIVKSGSRERKQFPGSSSSAW
jgi:hypothetical protein